ncbi:MAG TPA: ABC transporter ATP-binding protein [Candidatus Dorea intestinavium]|nr:ABC transporter ATP-binding protein [Candidatus Dorea intestinavium]
MLKTINLQKKYPDFSLDASIEVKAGRIVGLIGQNGAGKSTIFKAILGLIAIDCGEVELLGKEAGKITPQDKESLGVVLSNSGFSEYLTLKGIMPILKSIYPRFDESFFKEQAKKFGLPCDKKIKDFSAGMKSKLKVLVAISHNAKLLILDEPTVGLDVIARDDLLELLREFMEEDEERAVLISSHIASDLEPLCDELYLMDRGKIILHEDTDVLLSDYGLLKINEEQYQKLDKIYLLSKKKENYGYSCLTNEKQYYLDNYPKIVIEKGSIDGIVTAMIRGEKQ